MINIAIIPARGGSKGLPGKNIKPLHGIPLIGYSINAALESNLFDLVVVTSDDDETLNISLDFGCKIIKRPEYLSSDDSSSLDVITHTLETLRVEKGTFCLLQPTSPMRTNQHIVESYRLYEESFGSVISVNECEKHPFKTLIEMDGALKPMTDVKYLTYARQLLPKAFSPNGAIYICDVELYSKNKQLFYNESKYYLMDDFSSIDIDNIEDFLLCEKLLAK
jgi:N-acylneuraminate cytidylyltransferase